MAETKVIMPQMGESIFEGTLTKWLKKKGDRIERDEPLFEISTDKIDSEIPAPASGIVKEILVKEGQTVQINTAVAVIDDGTAASSETAAAETATASSETAAPETEKQEKPKARAADTSTVKRSSTDGMHATKDGPAPVAGPVAAQEPDDREEKDEDSAEEGIRSSPLVRRIAKENAV